jgi:hypothetical protein
MPGALTGTRRALLGGGIGISPAMSAGLRTSLVAYWKLDEASGNRADSAGANTLTDTNTVLAATGKVGNGADFELDTSEALTITDNAALSTGDIAFAVALWMKAETLSGSMNLLAKYAGAGQAEYALQTFDGSLFWSVSIDGTNFVTVSSSVTLSTGVWYYVVGWHDPTANTINVQVNNGAVDSVAHATGIRDGTGTFALGRLGSAASGYYDGMLDEVGVWKKLLSAAERTALYNNGLGLTYPFTG